jgi:hypothetical protein
MHTTPSYTILYPILVTILMLLAPVLRRITHAEKAFGTQASFRTLYSAIRYKISAATDTSSAFAARLLSVIPA